MAARRSIVTSRITRGVSVLVGIQQHRIHEVGPPVYHVAVQVVTILCPFTVRVLSKIKCMFGRWSLVTSNHLCIGYDASPD